jgi:hypothetical protein
VLERVGSRFVIHVGNGSRFFGRFGVAQSKCRGQSANLGQNLKLAASPFARPCSPHGGRHHLVE